jgi:hypothetical protein
MALYNQPISNSKLDSSKDVNRSRAPVLYLARQRGAEMQTATALDAPLWNARHGFGDRDKWLA